MGHEEAGTEVNPLRMRGIFEDWEGIRATEKAKGGDDRFRDLSQ